ncbi:MULTISPECIES: hypothetical protein [unclassified Fibrobacter]|uniref:hypothetical protein n=1 Tax=unclassified Fibrobacter TaxID=2634177 RepID=UPI000D6AD43A|nr:MULTISPECIES: hypothetical protein [unclassified Fibrobacter]PWJ65533.1 hypothetical protein BGX12_11319 [Fibrobacter sp. UWR4]PZW72298.1 hypothetical protein C8E88_100726 [Fibrobacter sp. UWR1]
MKKIFNSRAVLCASVFATALAAQAFAADAILFTPAVYQIGEVNQGDVKHFVLKGANVSGKDLNLETVMCQGIGCSNFKYPSTVKNKSALVIEFDLDFSAMEGPVSPTVVLVGTDGKTYLTSMDGVVKAPFFFNEKMFDTGYYTAGESRDWTFYVWETDRKARPDLTLSEEAAKDFSIKTKNVKVKVDADGKVKEGGKIPALKITLSTKGLSREGWELKQRSIRKIVSFKSKKYPNATPEVLVIGFWK